MFREMMMQAFRATDQTEENSLDDATIRRLNEINRRFYAVVADDFDTTRGKPWPGWRRLLPHIQRLQAAPLRLLDVGCGNGRFGLFVARETTRDIGYHGVDNNPALLDHARAALAGLPNFHATLEARDIITGGLPDGAYDLVALFGVLHHIPGAANRQALLRALADRVAPGGLLAFAAWRFYDYARFRERVVAWPDGLTVEPGDYLLDWRRGANALRYCHHVNDDELAALVAASGLTEVTRYRADGQTGDANFYVVLRNSP